MSEASVKGVSLWADAWQSLRRNRAAMFALGTMGFVVLLVLAAPLVPLAANVRLETTTADLEELRAEDEPTGGCGRL